MQIIQEIQEVKMQKNRKYSTRVRTTDLSYLSFFLNNWTVLYPLRHLQLEVE